MRLLNGCSRRTAMSLALLLVVHRALAATTGEGFIFPAAFNPSSPSVSSLAVRLNDSIVLEYEMDTYTTAIGVSFECFATKQIAMANATGSGDSNWLDGGVYENTGKVLWDFTADQAAYISSVGLAPPVWCNFLLFNYSIQTCTWGPWGIGALIMPDGYATDVVSASLPFELKNASSSSEPTMWLNPADKTASPTTSATTATATVNITCPPSGIPPRSGPVEVTSVDYWPPMAENLEFPVLDTI